MEDALSRNKSDQAEMEQRVKNNQAEEKSANLQRRKTAKLPLH